MTVPAGKPVVALYHFTHAEEERRLSSEGSGRHAVGEMLPITAGDMIFIPLTGVSATMFQCLIRRSISIGTHPELPEVQVKNLICAVPLRLPSMWWRARSATDY
jgi:hypothetical protein